MSKMAYKNLIREYNLDLLKAKNSSKQRWKYSTQLVKCAPETLKSIPKFIVPRWSALRPDRQSDIPLLNQKL